MSMCECACARHYAFYYSTVRHCYRYVHLCVCVALGICSEVGGVGVCVCACEGVEGGGGRGDNVGTDALDVCRVS